LPPSALIPNKENHTACNREFSDKKYDAGTILLSVLWFNNTNILKISQERDNLRYAVTQPKIFQIQNFSLRAKNESRYQFDIIALFFW